VTDWEKIVDAFWRKYHWDEEWREILHHGRQRIVRRSISEPTLQKQYWAISLQPLQFGTHDEAIKYAMGLVVLEDLLSKLLQEKPPPEEVDK
jgi:hypothetical protein